MEHDEYKIDNFGWCFGNNIDGQVSYIFNLGLLEGGSNTENLHVLFHERFHIFQISSFPEELFNWGTYTGFNNIENVKLTLMEDAALINYLNTHNIDDLKNYAAINQFRERIIGKTSSQHEAGKENIEGVAEYYSWNTVKDNDKARNDNIITVYKNKCKNKLVKCQIQDRYYFTGNIIGIALDELGVNSWKEKLANERLSIREQLFKYFQMSQREIEKRLNQSKVQYHYDEITQQAESELTLYKEQRDKEFSIYQHSNGIVINIEKQPCNLFGSVSSNNSYYIDSDTQLTKGSNGNSMCQDTSIMVNYFNTPYILKTEHNGQIQFKVDADTSIQIDENKISAVKFLTSKQDYNFSYLYIKTNDNEIRVQNRRGQLKSVNGEIALITDQ